MSDELSRRGFVKGAAATAALTFGGMSLFGCAADGNGGDDPGALVWDAEADIVVCGYGGAGASAAIEASRAGSSVIIIEKAPEGEEGGNTTVCGGGWIVTDPNDREGAVQFIRDQCPVTVTDEEIDGFVDELATTTEWVQGIGASVSELSPAPGCLYPNLPTAAAIPGVQNSGGPGATLFGYLRDAVQASAGVQVMYETAAHRLIFDPKTREVFGVKVLAGGEEKNIKANKAVILALGGYENNREISTQYCFPGVDIYPWGTPHNTGDGLPMVMEVGAKVRHFVSVEWGSFCCKPASEDAGVAIAMVYIAPQFDNSIVVNKYGARFMNEISRNAGFLPTPTHDKTQMPVLDYDLQKMEYANLPFYMVFDETKRAAGPVFNLASKDSGQTWAGVFDTYVWSDDNQAEIDAGYVFKADTIEELAEMAGVDAAGLAATVKEWNAACAAGSDSAFGRAEQMTPIETAPFYLTELALSFINTQGGPDRDAEHHVLDWEGNVIPRLYAGGEFGSIYGWLYQGAGNVPEALGNRTAGIVAAGETPWEA